METNAVYWRCQSGDSYWHRSVRQKFRPFSAAGSSKNDSSFADLVTGILKIGMRKKRFQVCIVEILCNKLIFFSEGRHRWVDFAQVYTNLFPSDYKV